MKVHHIFDFGSSREDLYLIQNDLFAVFDGFNSLDKFVDPHGATGGLIAATITRDIFARNGRTLKELAEEANRQIRKKMLHPRSILPMTEKRKSN